MKCLLLKEVKTGDLIVFEPDDDAIRTVFAIEGSIIHYKIKEPKKDNTYLDKVSKHFMDYYESTKGDSVFVINKKDYPEYFL